MKPRRNYVIIAGGRDFTDPTAYKKCKKLLDSISGDIVLYTGMANGADQIPLVLEEKYNYPIRKFPADWEFNGKAAGPIRNYEMLMGINIEGKFNPATHLIAFWDGFSSGTEHMISVAKNKGIKIKVIRYKRRRK